jgi:hypothetical protein
MDGVSGLLFLCLLLSQRLVVDDHYALRVDVAALQILDTTSSCRETFLDRHGHWLNESLSMAIEDGLRSSEGFSCQINTSYIEFAHFVTIALCMRTVGLGYGLRCGLSGQCIPIRGVRKATKYGLCGIGAIGGDTVKQSL